MKRSPLIPVLVLIALCTKVHAQEIDFGMSTVHDENIFDIYTPFPDQVTELELSVTKEWDFSQNTLGMSYAGSGVLFSTLQERNYHIHLLALSTSYRFLRDNDESDSPDSTQDILPGRADSLDQILFASAGGGQQFDGESFSEYDNRAFLSTIGFRQPIGEWTSATPSWAFTYREYPNLDIVTNFQNAFRLALRGDTPGGTTFSLIPAFAVKNYTNSSTYAYTVNEIHNVGPADTTIGNGKRHGIGNGISGTEITQRTRTFTAGDPSVRQWTLSAGIEQMLRSDGTRFSATYTRVGTPSAAARAIPQQLRNVLEVKGLTSTSQNEIYDDRFSYSANAIELRAEHPLPYSLTINAGAGFQTKTYTLPAMDLSDTVQLADRRLDDRTEISVEISRPIALGSGILKPQVDIHYLRNKSNAPFYDFEKKTILMGIEYSF